MKKIMQIGLILLLGLLLFSCGPGKKVVDINPQYSYAMQILFEKDFSLAQFDSLCLVDTIPSILKKWKTATFSDYETGKPMVEYYFIKRLGHNESFYRLIPQNDTIYNIYKRVVYGTKKED